MLTRLYRCLPAGLRQAIYTLFLGKLLAVARNPRLTWQAFRLRRRFGRFLYFFRDKNGMEIGGPSAIFGPEGAFPVYTVCKTVDGCNYSSVTVWEGTIAGDVYRYGVLPLGRQYIGEASEVSALVKPAAYDFLISSNCLEHVANPVKALKAWMEILRPGGVMLLVVPNKKRNFDRLRPDTSFEHLVRDYETNVTEADMTHCGEIVSLHDLALDSRAGDAASFRQRCLANEQNRCFHHHVFTPDCLGALFGYLDMPVLFRCSTEADHIILGQKK